MKIARSTWAWWSIVIGASAFDIFSFDDFCMPLFLLFVLLLGAGGACAGKAFEGIEEPKR